MLVSEDTALLLSFLFSPTTTATTTTTNPPVTLTSSRVTINTLLKSVGIAVRLQGNGCDPKHRDCNCKVADGPDGVHILVASTERCVRMLEKVQQMHLYHFGDGQTETNVT